MRHRVKTTRLGRSWSLRKATIISLAKAVLTNQSVMTTYTKAKQAVPLIEKLISLAKDNSLAAKRRAYKVLGDHRLISRLFKDIAGVFKARQSGFTRVLKAQRRRGDGSQMAILELTEKIEVRKPKKEKAGAKSVEKEAAKPAQKQTEEQPGKPKEERHKIVQEERKVIEKKTKPPKKFLEGLRSFFKKERDSL